MTTEDHDAEALFERQDAAAERRLADAERIGGATVVPVMVEGAQVFELLERNVHAEILSNHKN